MRGERPDVAGAQPREVGRAGVWPMVWLAIVVVFGSVFVWVNRADLPMAWDAVRDANPWLLGAAAGLSVLSFMNYGALYAAGYRAVGLPAPYWRMVRLMLAANFLNRVTKASGMGGLAVFVADAQRRGEPGGAVVSAYLVAYVLMNIAFTATLLTALVVIWVAERLTTADLVAFAVFCGYFAIQASLLTAALRSRRAVRALYTAPRRGLAVVLRRDATPQYRGADELYEAMRTLRGQPRTMLVPGVHALLMQVGAVAGIDVVLAAFGQYPGPHVALVAYSISLLFAIVGFTPGGLGFAEVSMGAVFVSFGVPGPVAAVVVVTYRLFEVWIPLAVGAVMVQVLARE